MPRSPPRQRDISQRTLSHRLLLGPAPRASLSAPALPHSKPEFREEPPVLARLVSLLQHLSHRLAARLAPTHQIHALRLAAERFLVDLLPQRVRRVEHVARRHQVRVVDKLDKGADLDALGDALSRARHARDTHPTSPAYGSRNAVGGKVPPATARRDRPTGGRRPHAHGLTVRPLHRLGTGIRVQPAAPPLLRATGHRQDVHGAGAVSRAVRRAAAAMAHPRAGTERQRRARHPGGAREDQAIRQGERGASRRRARGRLQSGHPGRGGQRHRGCADRAAAHDRKILAHHALHHHRQLRQPHHPAAGQSMCQVPLPAAERRRHERAVATRGRARTPRRPGRGGVGCAGAGVRRRFAPGGDGVAELSVFRSG
eukprot:ctg_2866.g598